MTIEECKHALRFSSSSSGLWVNGSPFTAFTPTLMIQMTLIIVVSRFLHFLLRPLGSSIIVSQMLTGIIVGPSLLGRTKFFHELLNGNNTVHLRMVGFMGMILFHFMIGVKIDLAMMFKTGKRAISIGFAGHIFPLIVSLAVWLSLKTKYQQEDLVFQSFDLFANTVLTWSMSSIVVVACLLDELNLLNTSIGRLTIASAFLETVLITLYRRGATVYFLMNTTRGHIYKILPYASLIAFALFLATMLFVFRPIVKWIVRRTPDGHPLTDAHFASVLAMAASCSFACAIIGHDISFGAFVFGLVLPSGAPLGSTLVDRLEGIISALFFPIYVASIGFYVDFGSLFYFLWGTRYLVFFDALNVFAKTISVAVAAYLSRMSWQDVLTVVLVMNAKGITELEHLHVWEDNVKLGPDVFTASLFEILAVAIVTAPLVKILSQPSKRYSGYKRRMVLNSKNNTELRVIACIHLQEHVAPTVSLLDAFCAGVNNPICIYLLHLTPLVGRVVTALVPYRQGKNSSYASAETDHIMTAFWGFEQTKDIKSLTVQPFVGISPYSSMYEDICSLALDKKASIIVLPYHKTQVNGELESTSEDRRSVNTAVLRYAPCSVGILVDHGIFNSIEAALANAIQNVVVYFLGGSDDREAVALAMRMGLHPRVSITVVHFRLKDEDPSDLDVTEARLDEDLIYDFRVENMNRNNMVYREEIVSDGEEMVNLIRMTCKVFDLIIVGRRDGQLSALTDGMAMWSEDPELGPLGDLLSSGDFGSQITTLVVQQQLSRNRPS